jgi:hypothetical protein
MMDSESLRSDAELRYTESLAREQALRDVWESEGSPMTQLGGSTGNTLVIHPLLLEIRQAEAHAARMGKALAEVDGKRGRGRPVGTESAPDRGRPGLLTRVK